MAEKLFKKYKNTKDLSLAMAAYSSASILGPLLVLGGIGYFLDKVFSSKPWLTIVFVGIAFIVSNILLYKKSIAITNHINSQYNKEKNIDSDKQ